MSFNPEEVRKDFSVISKGNITYLDTAATAQKPECVIQAVKNFYKYEYAPINRAVYEPSVTATERYNEVRRIVKKFIKASEEKEIVFTTGATAGINLIANGFVANLLQPGDEILITLMEHHANLVPWQVLAEKRGAVLKFVDVNDDGQLDMDDFRKKLTDRTKFVSVLHVSNVLGTVNPVKEITELAHEKGTYVLLDAAQSAPHMKIDVQDIGVDFLVFSGHKCYGPTGVGALYGKMKLLEKTTPMIYGGDMIHQVTIAKTTLQKPPLCFEAGTPNSAGVIGLGVALEYLMKLDLDGVSSHMKDLVKYTTEKLLDGIPNLTIVGKAPQKSGIISFAIKDAHSLDLGTLLGLKKFAIRTGNLCTLPILHRFGHDTLSRVSFGIYTTKADVDGFVTALKETLTLLK